MSDDKKIAHFFKVHPEATEVHQTSDGLLFIEKHRADSHVFDMARGKQNVSRAITTIKREDALKAVKTDKEETPKKGEGAKTDADTEVVVTVIDPTKKEEDKPVTPKKPAAKPAAKATTKTK